jgi:hypothetical protein
MKYVLMRMGSSKMFQMMLRVTCYTQGCGRTHPRSTKAEKEIHGCHRFGKQSFMSSSERENTELRDEKWSISDLKVLLESSDRPPVYVISFANLLFHVSQKYTYH